MDEAIRGKPLIDFSDPARDVDAFQELAAALGRRGKRAARPGRQVQINLLSEIVELKSFLTSSLKCNMMHLIASRLVGLSPRT